MGVEHVGVAAGGICLPDLDERVGDGTFVRVEDAAGDDDSFTERLIRVLTGKVVVHRSDLSVAVDWSRHLGQRLRNDDERLCWVTAGG